MKKLLIILLILLLSSACNLVATPMPEDPLDTLRTAAAATVVAMTTQAMQTQMALADSIATPTTRVLTLPPLDSTPGANELPTDVLEAEETPTNKPSCDLAEFVEETVPDGTKFPPSTSFVKTWTLKNVGTCVWTMEYDAVFVDGDAMNAPAAQALTSDRVMPGDSVLIQMTLTTPSEPGNYRAEFQLRNANDVLFSFNNPESTYWVEIEVTK